MDNRRENYRHFFGPGETLICEIQITGSGRIFVGEILSLSAGGIGVKIPRTDFALAPHDRVTVRFTLPQGKQAIEIRSEVKHGRLDSDSSFFGLQFLTPEDSAADAMRDREIWKFLMDLQRKAQAILPPQPKN